MDVKVTNECDRDVSLADARFPQFVRQAPTVEEIGSRAQSLCTSNRTKEAVKLWIEFYKQRGALSFFTSPREYVSTQFLIINIALREIAQYKLSRHQILFGDDFPVTGAGLLREEALFKKQRRDDVLGGRRIKTETFRNPCLLSQLCDLLIEATSSDGLSPSLDNLSRIVRPLLYLYKGGSSLSVSAAALVEDLCGHRIVNCDLRKPLKLNRAPSRVTPHLPYSSRSKGVPTPFLGVVIHREISRDDFIELDSLPIILAELNPQNKFSDDRELGRDPEDLFTHDVVLHGRFIIGYSGLRGLVGVQLLNAISKRLEFSEEFDRVFPRYSRYRDAACMIRFGLHHEGWFGFMFGSQFYATQETAELVRRSTGKRFPMNRFVAELFGVEGPWVESTPQPRHSLEWFNLFRTAPSEVADEFLAAVARSLINRCVPDDLGRIADPNDIARIVRRYWELVQRVAERE